MQVKQPEAVSKEIQAVSGQVEGSIVPSILGHGGTRGLPACYRRTGSVSPAPHY